MIFLIYVNLLRLYYCKLLFYYNMIYSTCLDSMGEKYYAGRATWVFTFLVVVSILYYIKEIVAGMFQCKIIVTFFYSVFWDLYCAAPERRDSCEHSSEAKAFHDYVIILMIMIFLWPFCKSHKIINCLILNQMFNIKLFNIKHKCVCTCFAYYLWHVLLSGIRE